MLLRNKKPILLTFFQQKCSLISVNRQRRPAGTFVFSMDLNTDSGMLSSHAGVSHNFSQYNTKYIIFIKCFIFLYLNFVCTFFSYAKLLLPVNYKNKDNDFGFSGLRWWFNLPPYIWCSSNLNWFLWKRRSSRFAPSLPDNWNLFWLLVSEISFFWFELRLAAPSLPNQTGTWYTTLQKLHRSICRSYWQIVALAAVCLTHLCFSFKAEVSVFLNLL